MRLKQPHVATLPISRFRDILGPEFPAVEIAARHAAELFAGRVVWHVNSTARGGGVVELLQSLLGYARGAGVDARRVVIRPNDEFFRITKRIHNRLHGWAGDAGPLGAEEHDAYKRSLAANALELAQLVDPGDVVFCHDPQTAGLVAPLQEAGATVVWRCHVGLDMPNDLARAAWDFLRPYVTPADAYVFSRAGFVWDGLDPERTWIVPPSIDVFSPKNQELAPETVGAILGTVGLAHPTSGRATFTRLDGTPGRVDRAAQVDQFALVPDDAPLIAQVSRWDALKDPVGVVSGFSRLRHGEAHLLLAGPDVEAVSDDPEGAEVLAEVRRLREGLAKDVRDRVHLACLPMQDVEENAAIVNAIQRRADVVVQKSLAEGFGLTVAEAMWKSRPVVASRCGGIQDQIPDDHVGVLLDDPSDLDG
ncbi:MAG: glycosyltransferase, partial [Actinomycetota bacterium]|nr:glycosyltransferase [Actinomycetota bacterium]